MRCPPPGGPPASRCPPCPPCRRRRPDPRRTPGAAHPRPHRLLTRCNLLLDTVSMLSALPGRDRLDELVHLLRDPTGYLIRRYGEYGPLFRTRFVMPAVFAIGEAANKT